jgi:hypothetical protein
LRQRERGVLVVEQAGQRGVHRCGLPLDALPEPHPQRQRVDERADRPLRAVTTPHPSEEDSAEDDVGAPGEAGEHVRPREVAQCRGADAQFGGPCREPGGNAVVDPAA